jgi:hypothetical protein
MRAMQMIAASERLTKLEFEADIDWETYPRSEYTCPGCGGKISFTFRNLNKHAHSTFTNLSLDDADAIEKTATGHVGDANSFVDFIVPGASCQYGFIIKVARAADLLLDTVFGLLSKGWPANLRLKTDVENACV